MPTLTVKTARIELPSKIPHIFAQFGQVLPSMSLPVSEVLNK